MTYSIWFRIVTWNSTSQESSFDVHDFTLSLDWGGAHVNIDFIVQFWWSFKIYGCSDTSDQTIVFSWFCIRKSWKRFIKIFIIWVINYDPMFYANYCGWTWNYIGYVKYSLVNFVYKYIPDNPLTFSALSIGESVAIIGVLSDFAWNVWKIIKLFLKLILFLSFIEYIFAIYCIIF